jgi:hypothetical protein
MNMTYLYEYFACGTHNFKIFDRAGKVNANYISLTILQTSLSKRN